MSEIKNFLPSTLDPGIKEKLALHWQSLQEANNRFNLTAITDPRQAAAKHYQDCLPAAEFIRDNLPPGGKVLDIGSGGGFPGLVLAAFCPQAEVFLLEAAQKKAAFLQETAARMGVNNVTVLWGRAEDMGKAGSDFRESFHIVTARAVAELSILAEYALPLTKANGIFLAMKGSRAEEELQAAANALQILGGEYQQTITYETEINKDKIMRQLLIIKKTDITPQKYPRRAGIPNKKPL